MAGANGSANGASRQKDKVRVAIIGVGNCANSLLQGVEYYKDADPESRVPGLMHVKLGDYHVGVDAPVGVADIYQVQGSYNQKLSMTIARAVPLGFDPLYVADEVKDFVEIIRYEFIQPGDGLQGSRVLFNMRPSSTDPWRTFDMTTYFDPGRFRLYTFTVGCLATCFKDREDSLAKLVASWKVQP